MLAQALKMLMHSTLQAAHRVVRHMIEFKKPINRSTTAEVHVKETEISSGSTSE